MNILLAVDGSANAYEAVHALKYFARAEQLSLLHAVNVPRPAYPMMLSEMAEEFYKTLERSMREDGERLLNRVQSLLPRHAGPSTKYLRIGSAAEVIVSMAQEQHADLIVIGARGLGPVTERLLGSVPLRHLDRARAGPSYETDFAATRRPIRCGSRDSFSPTQAVSRGG
jgi:nucleotide-binding universal stress UspA family protein